MIDWRGKIVLDDCLNFTIPLFSTTPYQTLKAGYLQEV